MESGKSKGFSLKELLGIIAITSILASLLFPVLARAREKAGEGYCLSGSRQFNRAMSLYAQDYDDLTLRSPGEMAPYVTAGGYHCPGAQIVGHPRFLETIDAVKKHEAGGGGRSPNMTWHSGSIMPSSVTGAIFWGNSWGSYSGDKITGIDSWYTGHTGSNYAMTSDEYTGTNGQVGPFNTHIGHVIDTSAAPSGAPSVSTILNEVCKTITNPDPSGMGYYAVYVDQPRGSAGYCAWHSYGTCSGIPVQIAFFFKLDGDSGCDPGDTSGLHSQGLAALANVSGHELAEARTDPRNGGWYDRNGNENGDKCAWTFGAPLVSFSNGTSWKIQGEWSNAAYSAGTGYPNRSGQNGCLSGQ